MSVKEEYAKDVRYFSSVRNYTLALLNAFGGVNLYINQEDTTLDKVYELDIKFGNYEKSIVLEDLSETDIQKGNFNYIPRMILSFEGMSKAQDRQTNKFQKFSKRIYHPDFKNQMLQVAYNSVSYDFHFSLLLQARGLTQASQVTEQILSYFKPTMNLNILECPIFNEKTETQIQISDPAFEINDDFEDKDVNIISVTFDITVRGNIYSPITLVAPLDTIKIFTHIWDLQDIEDSKMSSYYKFERDQNSGILNITERMFNGSIPYDEVIEAENENIVINNRQDYMPPQITIKTTKTPLKVIDKTI